MSEESPVEERSLLRRWGKPVATLCVLGLIFIASRQLVARVGLEWSAESIQSTVRGLGPMAPAGYLALVAMRQFFALPSVLVLTSAGLLFGAPLGALLGGLGITLNALVLFYSARLMGKDWVQPRIHARYPDYEDRVEAAGPLVIALMTGHPTGILTPFHFGAGITAMSVWIFVLCVIPAALFRAACYSFLGANILAPGTPRFWIATVVLVVVSLLPLAHPGLRARIFGKGER